MNPWDFIEEDEPQCHVCGTKENLQKRSLDSLSTLLYCQSCNEKRKPITYEEAMAQVRRNDKAAEPERAKYWRRINIK